MTANSSATSTGPVAGRRVFRVDILVVSLVMHFVGLALPLALLQIYDRILPAQAYGTTTVLVAGVAVAILLEAVLRYGRTALFAESSARYEAEATLRIIDRLRHADVGDVERRGTAAVSDAFRSIAQVRDFWSGQAGAALYELPFIALYIALIAYIGGWLALFPILLFVIAAFVSLQRNRGIARAGDELEAADQTRRDFAWSLFAAIDYLKATGVEGTLGAVWRRINDRFMARSADLEMRMAWVRENATTFGQLSTLLVVSFGAVRVIDGDLTTGALAACSMLAGRSIGPAMASLGYWSQLARIRRSQARVDDLLKMEDNRALGAADGDGDAAVERGEIRIEAPGLLSEPVTIPPGEVVHVNTDDTLQASRLMAAVAGMTEDPEIRVAVDGRPLTDYAADSYRQGVILVTQQLALVPGSILNNLTLYDPRYNNAVRDYSDRLGLQPFVDRLRHGVLTEVGPGTAAEFDEGIYQRIAIIRGLLRQPRILLLDHAAKGIDLDGIKRLAELLTSMQGQTTVLVASFKPALIEACSRSLDLNRREVHR